MYKNRISDRMPLAIGVFFTIYIVALLRINVNTFNAKILMFIK